MRYALINVFREKDGLVDGAWIEYHTGGTLESATERARATEQANSNRITVAVVEDRCYPPFSNIHGAKRLDIKKTLNEKIKVADQRSGNILKKTSEKEPDR